VKAAEKQQERLRARNPRMDLVKIHPSGQRLGTAALFQFFTNICVLLQASMWPVAMSVLIVEFSWKSLGNSHCEFLVTFNLLTLFCCVVRVHFVAAVQRYIPLTAQSRVQLVTKPDGVTADTLQ
jgi:hypothetical protein